LLGEARRHDHDDRTKQRGCQTYLDPNHPTQLAILRAINDLADERATNLAVDGCGAPVYAISLYALARAFGRLTAAAEGPEAQVANAMRTHPKYVSGTRRDEYELHQAIPGLIAKAGAEAVYATGLPDGWGIAIKISDGSSRALPAAMAGVLMRLGLDSETLRKHASLPVLRHGERIGDVRPCAEL
jgi:L-asparaginase II